MLECYGITVRIHRTTQYAPLTPWMGLRWDIWDLIPSFKTRHKKGRRANPAAKTQKHDSLLKTGQY